MWDYKEWDEDLVRHYVYTFLAQKVHGSGWPPQVRTEAEKDAYLDEWMAREPGLELFRHLMAENPAIRHMAVSCPPSPVIPFPLYSEAVFK